MLKPQNKIQLSTYPDSLGGDLKSLYSVLKNYFSGVVCSVHILPYYPSSADRGFSPITHKEVDNSFGTWKDVEKIACEFDLMSDLIVNHISSESPQFQDYLKKGKKSRYADWFVSSEKFSRRIVGNKRKYFGRGLIAVEWFVNFFRKSDFIFHEDGVNKFVLKKIYRPRPGSPFVEFSFTDGHKEELWCTFSEKQVDLDVENMGVQRMFKKTIREFSGKGIRGLRLDAVGYTGKKRGTDNFMISKTKKFIKSLAKVAHKEGMYILPEIHHNYKLQEELSNLKGVDFVYDFSLPMLVLHSIFTGDVEKLKHWINIRPVNQITTLDTHDGIGVVDVGDLLSQEEIDNVVETLGINGGNETLRASGDNFENVDVYQKNITFYSALGENDNKYLMARAIQFFVPGIPQVFYVGLLAGKNDEKRLEETGCGREIMRHGYTIEEVEKEIERPVVHALFDLIKFRNNHPAFNGEFTLLESAKHIFSCRWEKETVFCELKVDLKANSVLIRHSENKGGEIEVYGVC